MFKLFFLGYMGGPSNRGSGGGSNYLCLPEKPSYASYQKYKQSDASEIYIQLESNLFCALCERNNKNNAIMYPGSSECPDNWKMEYIGTLVAQRQSSRTEYVCLSQEAASKVRQRSSIGVTTITNAACKILPCGEDSYKANAKLNCAVCTQ